MLWSGVRMASFEEVSAELNQVITESEELTAALEHAGQLADEAAQLLTAVMRGADQLEDEFGQVVQQWSEVATRAAELSQAVTTGQQCVESYGRTLQVERASSNVAGATAPAGPTPGLPPTTWVERQRAQLPTYVTSGFHRDEDGHSDLVQSGAEPNGEDRAIAQHLVAIGRVRPRTFPTAAQHVEIKVGWRMRTSGVRRAEVVVNNRLCEGPLSCFELLPLLLLPGQTLVVHDPVRSHTFQGEGTR
ncbi:SCP1.201-like deaminase [Lentzea californiensis]|nr:SCP1.201-like deaminase [Lentzea californiensis]